MASADNVRQHLTSKNLAPTAQWVADFIVSIASRPNNVPLQATLKTAEFRLLGADITTSFLPTPTNTFPPNVNDPQVQELRIPGPIHAQVLDIEDVGRSRWSQVEAIEMDEKGETRKGHVVIRVVPDEEDNSDPNPPTHGARGPHKLLLQDAKGTKVFAFEMENVPGVSVDMSIGTKMILRDLVVARGVILLVPRGVELLGGKIEQWDKKWRAERKRVLKEKAGC